MIKMNQEDVAVEISEIPDWSLERLETLYTNRADEIVACGFLNGGDLYLINTGLVTIITQWNGSGYQASLRLTPQGVEAGKHHFGQKESEFPEPIAVGK